VYINTRIIGLTTADEAIFLINNLRTIGALLKGNIY